MKELKVGGEASLHIAIVDINIKGNSPIVVITMMEKKRAPAKVHCMDSGSSFPSQPFCLMASRMSFSKS